MKKTYKLVGIAQFLDGCGGEPIRDAAVIIENGKVAYAGKEEGSPSSADYPVIDCAGATVIPGLIEGHAHVSGGISGIPVLRRSLQRGITTVCSVSANKTGVGTRDAIFDGKLRGCANLIVGYTITPTNGHVRFRDANGPWEVRAAVREAAEATADFIKTAASGGFWGKYESCSIRNYTLEELEALVDEAHAWERPVVVHAHTQPGINNSITAGIDMIHHGAFIDEEGVRGIRAKDLYYMPTLRVTCDRNLAAWPDRPWMIAEMRQSQPIHRAGVRLAHELGVRLALGCDYPGSSAGWAVGDSTLWELGELVACGLTPFEALMTSTANADAYHLRRHYGIGTLEEGMSADLLVVRTDPLKDIMTLYDNRNFAMIVKAGNIEYATGEYIRYYSIDDE